MGGMGGMPGGMNFTMNGMPGGGMGMDPEELMRMFMGGMGGMGGGG